MTPDAVPDRHAIGILSDEMRTQVLASAEASQEISVALLGLATILACRPDGLQVDVERVEALLGPACAQAAAERVRFVEFVGSLAMWVNALGPEGTSGPAGTSWPEEASR